MRISITRPDKTAYGGGLYNNNNLGSPSMANLIFYKNFALVGGGLYNINADALIVNVSWIGNQGDFGAAVRNIDCSPTLVNALFVGNISEYVGGAIYNSNGRPHHHQLHGSQQFDPPQSRAKTEEVGQYSTMKSPISI